MNLRGVYDSGIESCFSLVPSRGIWKILWRREDSTFAQSVRHEVILPQKTARDSYQAFWAEFSGETPSIVQIFEYEGSKVHHILMSVVQP